MVVHQTPFSVDFCQSAEDVENALAFPNDELMLITSKGVFDAVGTPLALLTPDSLTQIAKQYYQLEGLCCAEKLQLHNLDDLIQLIAHYES